MVKKTMAQKPHILLVGCGKMGGALLSGWLTVGCAARVTVLDPHDIAIDSPLVTHVRTLNDIDTPDIVVLAIKPQILGDVCAALKPVIKADTPILSIAAGQTSAAISRHFHDGQPVIRAMPNLPAAIGRGITAAYANQTGAPHKEAADTLLQATGACVWLKDESRMDAVTAVSGSGPAYVFYLIECLAEAGIQAGLPADIAAELARQTVIGAAALADQDDAPAPGTLREHVTSKGGTTEAALSVLMDGRWRDILSEAVAKAKTRAEELSQ